MTNLRVPAVVLFALAVLLGTAQAQILPGLPNFMALNPAQGTLLVTDVNNNTVRVVTLATKQVTAVIPLPSLSVLGGVAVDSTGNWGAVVLTGKNQVALLDLTTNTVAASLPTGFGPRRVAFAGSKLLVTNVFSSTISVFDLATKRLLRTVRAGWGSIGIAVWGNTALVTNYISMNVAFVDLATYAVTSVPLYAFPEDIAVAGDKALITMPASRGYAVLDLPTRKVARVLMRGWIWPLGALGVATDGVYGYITLQTRAQLAVINMATGAAIKTMGTEAGPTSLVVDASAPRLLVMAKGTNAVQSIDLPGLTDNLGDRIYLP